MHHTQSTSQQLQVCTQNCLELVALVELALEVLALEVLAEEGRTE